MDDTNGNKKNIEEEIIDLASKINKDLFAKRDIYVKKNK